MTLKEEKPKEKQNEKQPGDLELKEIKSRS